MSEENTQAMLALDTEAFIDAIVARNPAKVEQAKTNPSMLGWFVGQVMKETHGKANPKAVTEILRRKLCDPSPTIADKLADALREARAALYAEAKARYQEGAEWDDEMDELFNTRDDVMQIDAALAPMTPQRGSEDE